jgi:serine/threonine-protein kinase
MLTQQNPHRRYTILRELGGGSTGKVYAARNRSTGAFVALKILDPALCREAEANFTESLLQNARSAARLRHRNIVKVVDVGDADGSAYVAMELVEGESLRHMLDNHPLSIARAIRIFDDIASALAYAHEEEVVHRGVRPSNIIVLRSGVAKLGDFGSGQVGEAALRYMSPEQVRGEPVDHRSDLFSLGAVLYEMLARRAPFGGSSPQEIRQGILHAEPPLPSQVNPHVPVALDRMVFTLLAGHPDDRFADARILLRELQRLEEALGLGPTPASPQGAAEPRVRTAEPNRPRDPAPAQDAPPLAPDPPAAEELQLEHDVKFMADRAPVPPRSSGSRAASFAALAVTLVVLGLSVFFYYSPSPSESPTTASGVQELPAEAAAPSPSAAPTPVAVAPVVAPVQPESLPPRESEQRPTAATAPAQEAPPPLDPRAEQASSVGQPAAKISEPQPGGTAKLILAVSPQGELYIDGKHYGTTPPIKTLDLEPGMRRIEIRSGSRKPYVTYMAVQPGDQRRVRHDFGAKPSRPPT